MQYRVHDSDTKEVIGDVPTPWLIERGRGRAWRSPSEPRIWNACDFPGAVVPEGAEVRHVYITRA